MSKKLKILSNIFYFTYLLLSICLLLIFMSQFPKGCVHSYSFPFHFGRHGSSTSPNAEFCSISTPYKSGENFTDILSWKHVIEKHRFVSISVRSLHFPVLLFQFQHVEDGHGVTKKTKNNTRKLLQKHIHFADNPTVKRLKSLNIFSECIGFFR